MPDHTKHPLLEALKIAKASPNGLPMQIQNTVKEIAESSSEIERSRKASEVSRWLYAECANPGIDQFTVMGYTALRNALAAYIPEN